MNSPKMKWIASTTGILLLLSTAAIASPYFSITPVYLPTQISPGASAVASYIVTNNTGLNLNNLGIRNLVDGLSQNTTANGSAIVTCRNPIVLTAAGTGASCLLQVTITRDVYDWRPQVCANIPPHSVYCSQPNTNDALTTIVTNPTIVGQKIVVANQGEGSGGTGPSSVLTFLTSDQGDVAPYYTLYGNPAFQDVVSVYVDNANHLWAIDYNANAVYKFQNVSDIGNTPPVVTISGDNTGLNNPVSVAIDQSGKIYISNHESDTISIYAQTYQQPGTYNVAPTATISGSATQLSAPSGITFDSKNRLYVANSSEFRLPQNPNVAIYAANATGNSAPEVLLTADNLFDPAAVALDVHDNLWVTDFAYAVPAFSKILKYDGPVTTVEPISCVLQGVTIVGPVGLVANVDFIWTSFDLPMGSIQKFTNPPVCNGILNVDPVTAITGTNTTLSRTVLMAIYTG